MEERDDLKEALMDFIKGLSGTGCENMRNEIKSGACFTSSYKIIDANIKYNSHLHKDILLYVKCYENSGNTGVADTVILNFEFEDTADSVVKRYHISEFYDF